MLGVGVAYKELQGLLPALRELVSKMRSWEHMGGMPDVVSVQEVYTVMLISLKPGLCCFINSVNLISYLTPLCSLFLISNTEDKAYLTNSPCVIVS